MEKFSLPSFRSGFTLIELSIVLVIIGLIIGGVLVGRDLIKASEIRATISQLESYRTAVNTFRLKYNALPGDIQANAAASFGMTPRSGAFGHGDGNNKLDTLCGTFGWPAIGCETVLLWTDLSYANLISGSFLGTDALVTSVSGAQIDNYVPAAKIGKNNHFEVLNVTAQVWMIRAISSIDAVGLIPSSTEALTPNEAYAIDSKTDDGMPAQGNIMWQHITGWSIPWPPLEGFTDGACTVANAGKTYYNTANGNVNACAMQSLF
jgi:prepilin-type N-terminal cleavage/methylation domain-containing protein